MSFFSTCLYFSDRKYNFICILYFVIRQKMHKKLYFKIFICYNYINLIQQCTKTFLHKEEDHG